MSALSASTFKDSNYGRVIVWTAEPLGGDDSPGDYSVGPKGGVLTRRDGASAWLPPNTHVLYKRDGAGGFYLSVQYPGKDEEVFTQIPFFYDPAIQPQTLEAGYPALRSFLDRLGEKGRVPQLSFTEHGEDGHDIIVEIYSGTPLAERTIPAPERNGPMQALQDPNSRGAKEFTLNAPAVAVIKRGGDRALLGFLPQNTSFLVTPSWDTNLADLGRVAGARSAYVSVFFTKDLVSSSYYFRYYDEYGVRIEELPDNPFPKEEKTPGIRT
jgi:hypothetical protein